MSLEVIVSIFKDQRKGERASNLESLFFGMIP